jgi:hypothetical protein
MQTITHTGEEIRCLEGVSIPCWPLKPSVHSVSWLWMRNYPPSKSVCQKRSNYWYEQCQTTFGLVSGCRLDHCNDHILRNSDIKQNCRNPCDINLFFNSLPEFKKKTLIKCRAGPCILSHLRDIYCKSFYIDGMNVWQFLHLKKLTSGNFDEILPLKMIGKRQVTKMAKGIFDE